MKKLGPWCDFEFVDDQLYVYMRHMPYDNQESLRNLMQFIEIIWREVNHQTKRYRPVENNNNQALEFIPSSGRKLYHTISWDIWILITSPISLSLGLALLLRVAERYPQFEHSPIIFGFSFVLAIIFLGARRYFR